MVATVISAETIETTGNKWLATAQELGPDFASRAADHGPEGSVVADHYFALR